MLLSLNHLLMLDSMLDYLDRLRAKPRHVRKRIAFLTTVALSFVIASVWWGSWNAESAPLPEKDSVTASIASPWGVVRDTFLEAKEMTVSTFNDTMNDLKNSNLEYASESNAGNKYDGDDLSGNTTPDENIDETITQAEMVHHEEEHAASEMSHTRPRAVESVAASGVVE